MKLDKDEIKNSLSLEQVYDLFSELGGEPVLHDGFLISRTICHNAVGEGSYKLYYYENTHLCHCFTDCEPPSFDIFELVCKVKAIAKERKSFYGEDGNLYYRDWALFDAVYYVANFFGIVIDESGEGKLAEKIPDWDIIAKYEKTSESTDIHSTSELKIYSPEVLKYLPHPLIVPWQQEGISYETCEYNNICYDPKNQGIVIPHYDINGNLVGIRERTLIKEEEQYGKYRPAILEGKMYNHPLGLNLYGLNNSKDNIRISRQVFVFESEKSVLLFGSMFGDENNQAVACCGSALTSQQFNLLYSLGVNEIIIAFDRQYQEIGDDEWKRWTTKLENIHTRYGGYVNITYMFDREHLLSYKSSPIDEGKEKFLYLYQNRF